MEALNSYQDWKHCITELCGIPLTQAFIEQRLAALRDAAEQLRAGQSGAMGGMDLGGLGGLLGGE